MGKLFKLVDQLFRMGQKTQVENKKLNVPAPGAYNIPEKVSETFGSKF